VEALGAFVHLVPVTLLQSLIYAFAALGIMIPFRVLAFPDLTSEGSFPLGACVCAAVLAAGAHPIVATAAAVAAGFAAGCATALVHQHARVNTLLCGILVLTALYSINIRVMGQPNIPLFGFANVFELALGAGKDDTWRRIALLGALAACACLALWWLLRTEIGTAMRAVGASLAMARAQGVDVGLYTLWGLGIGNAFAALGGSLLAQNQGFADVNLGFGVLINGLAAVILGEAIVGAQTVARLLAAPVVGAIVYYQVVSMALAFGLQPSDLKLVTAVFVLVMLLLPAVRGRSLPVRMRE